MRDLRAAVLGCGFWAPFQLAGWREVGGVEVVALYNRTRAKAEALAARFGVLAVYDDADELLRHERPDVADIITDVDTHSRFVHLAARHGVAVICQKPMAPDLPTAEAMVRICRDAGVPFMVHENWRWQRPIREVKAILSEGALGRPFRGRITFSTHFPVFDNQPFLADVERFIIADIGSHILDVARFLFGEPVSVACHTARVNRAIRGEDVATVLLRTTDGAAVTCEMSYASHMEHDRFPETYIVAECESGTVELGPDFWVRVTTADGTQARRCAPPHYAWADPQYDVVHSSIVPCCADLLRSLRTGEPAETSGEDNLRTVRLVWAAYDSAATGRTVAP